MQRRLIRRRSRCDLDKTVPQGFDIGWFREQTNDEIRSCSGKQPACPPAEGAQYRTGGLSSCYARAGGAASFDEALRLVLRRDVEASRHMSSYRPRECVAGSIDPASTSNPRDEWLRPCVRCTEACASGFQMHGPGPATLGVRCGVCRVLCPGVSSGVSKSLLPSALCFWLVSGAGDGTLETVRGCNLSVERPRPLTGRAAGIRSRFEIKTGCAGRRHTSDPASGMQGRLTLRLSWCVRRSRQCTCELEAGCNPRETVQVSREIVAHRFGSATAD